MKKIIFLALLVASFSCKAQSAEGSMDCTVTGNVVVASEEGKFKSYSSIQGGVKANEKVILTYRVSSNSIYIDLKREQGEKDIVINAYVSTDERETTAELVNAISLNQVVFGNLSKFQFLQLVVCLFQSSFHLLRNFWQVSQHTVEKLLLNSIAALFRVLVSLIL